MSIFFPIGGAGANAVALRAAGAGESSSRGALTLIKRLACRSAGESSSLASLHFRALRLRSTSAGESSGAGQLREHVDLRARSLGSSSSRASLQAANRMRAQSRGDSSSSARLSLAARLRAAGAGQSSSLARLRLNAAGNVALEARSRGESSMFGALAKRARVISISAGESSSAAALTVERPLDAGLTFYVDVIPAALAAAADHVYRARMTANGAELPIRSFTLTAAEGALGTSLVAKLAKPRPDLLSRSATYALALGVKSGASYVFENLITGARYGGRDHTVALDKRTPADDLTLKLIDVLGDRWQLAPELDTSILGDGADDDGAPVDPQTVLRDERGAPILPLKVFAPGLTLREAMRRVYVEGCGFSSVETNIPDRKIARVDISRREGYMAALSEQLAIYEPVFGAEGNRLRVIDADEAVNAPAYDLPLGSVVTAKDSQPVAQLVDCVEVVYQERALDGEVVIGEQLVADPQDTAGTFGEPGYTEIDASRTFRLYARASDVALYEAGEAPSIPVSRRELVREVSTIHNANLELTFRGTIQYQFDALGRESGHTRTVETLLPTFPAGDLALQTAERETCTITYRPHPTQPGKFVQDKSIKSLAGLVLVDNDQEYLGRPLRLRLTDAHKSGRVDPGGDQSIVMAAIATTVETLIVLGDGQLTVSVASVDELANTSNYSSATPRVGDITLDSHRLLTRRVLVRLPGATTTRRRVAVLNAGEVPRAEAIRLARRKLARLNNPPRRVSISLPAVDFAIRRGQVVRAFNREGASGLYLVTGYTITGERLGSRDQKIAMTLDAKEITAGRG